ncbi:hypothetical protein THARTR1_07460 [Trichoderma harzianum]|uniref:Uncharacterized protein n=1 Tax=Trichoderma harzianum TaxID=5544 RepID=A0A2K0U395_TRIHA|nr:hypothetical protein THARTR1_07460 [Trichoderma harzianum]
MAHNSNLDISARNVIFDAEDYLYEEENSHLSDSLGGFKTSNPIGTHVQRQMISVSEEKSRFKKTVELVLCVHGWKSPDRKDPMTLIVLGVNLSCHVRNIRFQSVQIKLKFHEDDKRDPADLAKAHPQVAAYAPFVQQKLWNTTVAHVIDTNQYGGKVGVDQVGQAEVSVNKSSEVSYTRQHFDRGSAHPLYNDRTGRIYGVEWFCEQNNQQDYGVMPNFHLAVLLQRSHDGDRPLSFRAIFDMRAEAGFRHDIEQGLRRAFRGLRPEDDPVYFDPSKEKPDAYGVGVKLLESIQVDNLGALAEGMLLSKLIGSAGGALAGLEPMKGL